MCVVSEDSLNIHRNLISQVCKIRNMDSEIEFVKDLQKRAIDLAGSPEIEADMKSRKDWNPNGTVIPPDKDGKWHILLSTASDDYKRGLWLRTLAHEMTHVEDHCRIQEFYDFKSFYPIHTYNWYETFWFLTEIHAYKNGSLYLKWCLDNIEEFKTDKELYLQSVFANVEDVYGKKESINRYLYCIAQIIGRLLAAWELYGEYSLEELRVLEDRERIIVLEIYDILKGKEFIIDFGSYRKYIKEYISQLHVWFKFGE